MSDNKLLIQQEFHSILLNFDLLRVFILLLLLQISSCASELSSPVIADRVHLKSTDIVVRLPYDGVSADSKLKLRYLGVGGFAMELEGNRIITAPFYSQPPLWRNIPFVPMRAREENIDDGFPGDLRDEENPAERRVQSIVVGHSHYDHLLDVPYLMKNHLLEAKAYGSDTMAGLLKASGLECSTDSTGHERAISVSGIVDSGWQLIAEGPTGRVRIMPLTSHHAPHLFGYIAQKGFTTCEKSHNLRTAADWMMGEVYAYLIDFVTEYGEVSYRVFYQDTAGLFKYEPTCETHTESECQRHCDSILVRGDTSIECELRRRKVDVAILTLAGAHNLDGKYLGKLVARLQADLYIVGHWEDFFDNFNESPKVVRGSDADLFINRLESSLRPGDQWVLPYPSKTITVGHGSNF